MRKLAIIPFAALSVWAALAGPARPQMITSYSVHGDDVTVTRSFNPPPSVGSGPGAGVFHEVCCLVPVQFSESNTVPGTATPAIGGAIGSPTVVTKQAGGVIDIGQAFSDAAAPYINALVNAFIVAGLGWCFALFTKKTGIQIDAAHRDSIVAATQRQAASLIADGLAKVENGKVTVKAGVLGEAAVDAFKSVPDAAKHFGIDPTELSNRIVDEIGRMLAPHVATAPLAPPAPPKT